MFIPYRARIKVTRIPIATILVSVVCLLVFWAQTRSEARIVQFADNFCAEDVARDLVRGQRLAFPGNAYTCRDILVHIYFLGSRSGQHLQFHVDRIKAAGDDEAAQLLTQHYGNFAAQAPADLTHKLTHQSGSWNPLRLLSATISHGSWDHVIGNLFFFVAFAMVVETVLGPVLFVLIFLAMGLGSGALENMLTLTREGRESLGLSGVVMSMMTLAAYLAPRVKIKFFYFYFLFFGFLSWPLWSVAGWYVFWNLWDFHFYREWSNVSYVGHLCGAAMGLILGVALFRDKRHWVQESIVSDEPTLKDEESWFYKLNAIGATPVVTYLVLSYGFLALIFGLYLFVTFIQTFAAQLLIAAPVVAGLFQIYRMKKSPAPARRTVEEGMKLIAQHRFTEAEKLLKPLAEANNARAQHVLGTLYASSNLSVRNMDEALTWFRAAARRGNAEALHELGTRYLHGLGVVKDLSQAVGYLEEAARKGVPESAATLGHLYENGPKDLRNNETAIEWYYKAGTAYAKAGRTEDAQAMVKTLQNLAGRYPVVYQLVAELEQRVATRSARLANATERAPGT